VVQIFAFVPGAKISLCEEEEEKNFISVELQLYSDQV
jgi:hypothetical protein